jgi:hypothetical protein
MLSDPKQNDRKKWGERIVRKEKSRNYQPKLQNKVEAVLILYLCSCLMEMTIKALDAREIAAFVYKPLCEFFARKE